MFMFTVGVSSFRISDYVSMPHSSSPSSRLSGRHFQAPTDAGVRHALNPDTYRGPYKGTHRHFCSFRCDVFTLSFACCDALIVVVVSEFVLCVRSAAPFPRSQTRRTLPATFS